MEWLMSDVKSAMFIAASRRKERWAGGGRTGSWSMARAVKMGKWSEGDRGEHETDGLRVESEAVITRSSVWPSEWVENLMCCVRFKEDKISENCLA
jgi:hypothetical protein